MPTPSPRAIGEFELIARYFKRSSRHSPHVLLGVGDDCALLQPPAGEQLAISTDTLVAGHHFFVDVDSAALGHKALAVNLSDLAACGASPLAFTLALTLPAVDEPWLAAFASGLLALADTYQCALVGGDTTSGPLSITITAWGSVPIQQALVRSHAQLGDDIYVSHDPQSGLGDARLALHLLQQQRGQATAASAPACSAAFCQRWLPALRQRLDLPQPRIGLGLALRGLATACCDLSDGLQGDLRHILAASRVGALLWPGRADGSGVLAACSPALRSLGDAAALDYALAGGDDYELLFTAPAHQRAAVAHTATQTGLALTRIGQIDSGAGLRLLQADGSQHLVADNGFKHFA